MHPPTMRREFALVLVALLFVTLCAPVPFLLQMRDNRGATPDPGGDALDCSGFLPYATQPDHIWNRVYRQLVERRDATGKIWGCDEVDPLLWQQSRHILAPGRYAETVRLLDEFSSTHAERLIHDPLVRAIFQHDLWAVFDWLAQPASDHRQERLELEHRLAAIIKSVALTPAEIQHLPENYAPLLGSITNDGLALPDSESGWLLIGRDDATPAAPTHFFAFPRSLFLVYMKIPFGGLDASRYLEALRTYSRQRQGEDCQSQICSVPQFPVGTELALARRALLIDTAGQPTVSPVTESVQLRRYVKIPFGSRFDFDGSTQQTAEFQLTRRDLLQGAIRLRRVGEDETHFPVFSTHGIDVFEDTRFRQQIGAVTVRACHGCHQGIGAYSFTTYSRMQFGRYNFVLVHASTEAQETTAVIKDLQLREDSWLLQP